GLHTDEGRRHQNGLVNRPAHRCNTADLVHRGANDCKVEPLMAADIAVKDVSDMQTKIHVGCRLAAASRRSFKAAMLLRAPIAAHMAGVHALARSSAVKMASVPSPISFNTSPPCSCISETMTSA